jgi:hypothetical protein
VFESAFMLSSGNCLGQLLNSTACTALFIENRFETIVLGLRRAMLFYRVPKPILYSRLQGSTVLCNTVIESGIREELVRLIKMCMHVW